MIPLALKPGLKLRFKPDLISASV